MILYAMQILMYLSVSERLTDTTGKRVFFLQVAHERLLTNYRKSRCGLYGLGCHFCFDGDETTLHVLRDCPLAAFVWLHLVPSNFKTRFFMTDLKTWISFNLC
jgi:hypothetical protein